MKKMCFLTLLLCYSIVCFSQDIESLQNDSSLSPTIIIEETVDSPFVAIFLSQTESYIAEYSSPNLGNRKHLDKMDLHPSLADYLYRAANEFCIVKTSPKTISRNMDEYTEPIRYDLINISLTDQNKELLITKNKDIHVSNKYSPPYIQFIECIDSLCANFRKRIVSHPRELDPIDPVLNMPKIDIDTIIGKRPFYAVILYCTFLDVSEEMFRIDLLHNNSFIQDWRCKKYAKNLPKEIVDWLYGQIQNVVNAIEEADNSQHFLNPQIYNNTLNDHILEYPLSIDIIENEDGSERETYLNGESLIKSFSSDFIDVVKRICKTYHDTCHK